MIDPTTLTPAMAASLPGATLDPIRRLRVLAQSVPGATLIEQLLDAPLDDVWAVATDFPTYLHRFEGGIRSARVLAAHGPDDDRAIDLRIQTIVGLPMRMNAIVRPGYCWMEARPRLYVVGLAAIADGARTRFAHVEGLPVPGGRLLAPLIRLAMAGDLRRIEALAQERRQRR